MMALSFLNIIASIMVALLLYPLLTLTQNYLRVRTLGLPIVFSPFGRLNPFGVITQPYIAPFLTRLSTISDPFSIFQNFVDYSTNSCFFLSRYTLHECYGPAFFIVTPGLTELVIADAPAAAEVQTRRKDFIKNELNYKPLEILGPNVVTLNGEAWARHRRITTPPFNERNSALVWKQSLLQASAMLKSWIGKGERGVGNTLGDTMALALNVLMAAGFGKRFEFGGGSKEEKGDSMSSYRNALSIVLGNLYGAIMTSMLMGLPSWALPKKFLDMKSALKEAEEYILKMIEEERAGLVEKSSEGDNLMSVLLKASESEAMGKGRMVLSDEEIVGNLFIYNLAGHDTTSNTLAYAVIMLATDAKVQDWLHEEITSVFEVESVEKWNYERSFHQLKRCLAVLVSLIIIRYYDIWLILSLSCSSKRSVSTAQYSTCRDTQPPRTNVSPSKRKRFSSHHTPSY
jgi:cytochrome P450